MRLAGKELKKVTLNLFAEDVAWLERVVGYGWTEVVRDKVHEHIREYDQAPTIGELYGE